MVGGVANHGLLTDGYYKPQGKCDLKTVLFSNTELGGVDNACAMTHVWDWEGWIAHVPWHTYGTGRGG